MKCIKIFPKTALMVTAILAFTITLNSCSDDPLTTSGSTVTGKLLDFESHAVSNVEVKIENQSVMTSADGSFSFNNVSMPYDLNVIDPANKDRKSVV